VDESAQEELNGAFVGVAETNSRGIELIPCREECLLSGEALQSREGDRLALCTQGEDRTGFNGTELSAN
jgi:hypothetical protein